MLVSILTATIAISTISLLGAFFFIAKKMVSKKITIYSVSFAAGVLLTTAFLDLLPEALEQEKNIFLPVLVGILVFFFMERFLLWFHHHDHTHDIKPSAALIIVGDGLHNFFDGVAIAAAFLTNSTIGLTTTLAIVAHEVPQEIADFSILIGGGMTKNKALFFNFLSALTAVAGGILGFYFLRLFEKITPIALSFTAGVFIYIACSDLIPDLHQDFKKQKRLTQSLPFILGVLIMILINRLIKHGN